MHFGGVCQTTPRPGLPPFAVKKKSLYGQFSGFLPALTAGKWLFKTFITNITAKGIVGNGHVNFVVTQTLKEPMRRHAVFNARLNDFTKLLQLGKLRLGANIGFVQQSFQRIASRLKVGFGFIHHENSLKHGRKLINNLSVIHRESVANLSYAERKTMVSWIKIGWDLAGDWGGLNRGFAP